MINRKKIISTVLIFALTISMVFSTVSFSHAYTYTGKYWLKVNEQCNVITAYERVDGKWKPVRAMLCSTGLNGATPRGTFYTQGKWNWGELMNDVYGQYCTHITQDILFHSVYYTERFDKTSQPTSEFNKLGQAASHGCIRLSVMDSKWIYDKCATGTKVTVYRSSDPGPLGKPYGITVSPYRYEYWDPTDPDPSNPYYLLDDPTITVSSKKNLTVQYGSSYKLKSYVYAKDPNTFMSLTPLIKVSKVRKYSSSKDAYVKADFSTKSLGTYKITYKVDDPYSGKTYKTIKIKVVDNLKAPVISGAKNRTVVWGSRNAIGNVTAKQPSAVRTKQITTYIKAPGSSSYKAYSYASAKNYKFAKLGEYKVRYEVKNKYSPYKKKTKTITITSKKGEVNKAPVLTVPESTMLQKINSKNAFAGVSAKHAGKNVTSRVKVYIKAPGQTKFTQYTQANAKAYVFKKRGEYTLKYTIKNAYTPYQIVTKTRTVNIYGTPILPK